MPASFQLPARYSHPVFGTVTRSPEGHYPIRRRDQPGSAYPRSVEILRRAEITSEDDKADSFDDLCLPDLLHANAITGLKVEGSLFGISR